MGDPPVGDDPNAMGAGLVQRLVETTHARELKGSLATLPRLVTNVTNLRLVVGSTQ
jgi:hypothetical protein